MAPRANRTHDIVASVPLLTIRTFSTEGTQRADQSRHLHLERIRYPEAQPVLCRFADCFNDDIRSMAEDCGTPGPDVVNIFASFDIPDV